VSLDDLLPKSVAGHDVGERLGVGAMGLVVRGQHVALGREVAIKFRFRAARTDEVLLAERFRQGAIRQSEVDHPGVAQLFDFIEGDDYQAIIMEFLGGGSVEGWIRRDGRLPMAAAIDVAIRVCDAMAFAHEAGVIHRDIKPGNLMLGEKHVPSSVKVTDFGVAKAPERSPDITVVGANVGTIWYMPPEQLSSQSHIDPRVDVYAIGATLYEMLTGHVPFEKPDAAEVFKRFLDGEPMPPIVKRNPDVPRAIVAIVEAALDVDADARVPSAAALGALLRSAARLEGLIYPSSHSEMAREVARDASIGQALSLLPDDVRSDIAFGVRASEIERGSPTQSLDAISVATSDLSMPEAGALTGRTTMIDFEAQKPGDTTATEVRRERGYEDDDECTIITVLNLPDEEDA
jgi:serine/threonine protein kinase